MENGNYTLQEENRILANHFLERNVYNMWRTDEHSMMELYLTGRCNQQCQYCYIHQHGKELYPDIAHDKAKILDNLQKIMNWYIKNRFICEISVFSADFVQDYEFSNKFFEIIYNTFKEAGFKNSSIGIPSNMSWIENEKVLNNVLKWIEAFRKDLNIDLYFSCSIDGKYCDDLRKIHGDEFYNKLFKLALKYNWGFHPMIAAGDIDKWIDNIDWWKDGTPNGIYEQTSYLEVRNEEWTDEAISNYCLFLAHCINKSIPNRELTREEKIKYINKIFFPSNIEKELVGPISICFRDIFNGNDKVTCSFNGMFAIRAGDLAIPFCHRLSYDELILGNYVLDENGEISYFEPKNVEGLITKRYLKPSCLPYCEQCEFVSICGRFCHGNAYEVNHDMFIPVKENCNLQKAKFSFLISMYASLGLLDDDLLDEVIGKNNPDLIQFKYLRDSIISGGNQNG